ncbi:hypothetical protein EMPS_04389 [Entomortierella parvispora]|uniref:Major facilitator superfamily (MFS) profile domain-containing protein n=1 Tax=Entomortierella parvispora TaxID=205924 RepID=A0A9P3H958_9FUNG|nr:hypothetical protein EMPS_04389 [Entomortierella parvispora]
MSDTAHESVVESTVTTPEPNSKPSSIRNALPWFRRLREIKGLLLFLVSMAAMLDIINVASITIALPSILRDVGYHPNQLQWCVSAYALTYAAFLLVGGRMGDLFGHKRIFLLGTSWFAIWALVCGFARSPIFMSVARAMEGAGAGFTIPSALALLTTSYRQGPERTFALSVFSGAAITGQTIGVLLGGVLDATIGWSWIFYLTAILSFALSFAGFLVIPDYQPDKNRISTLTGKPVDLRIDYGGAACFTVGIIAIIYYLTESTTSGWAAAQTLAPFAVGIAFLIAFVIIESKIEYPIMPFHIWKSRRFASSIIIIVCLTATYNTMIFYSSLTFQNVMHFNALITACCYIVHGVGLMFGLYTVTRLFAITRTKFIMIVGLVFIIVSSVLFAQCSPNTTYWHWAFPALIVNFCGLSPTWMCCQVNAVADAADEDQGVVGAVYNVGIQMGAPIGLAIANIIAEAHTPAVGDDLALMEGYSSAFYAYGVMGGVGILAVVLFAANRDPDQFPEEGGAPLDLEEASTIPATSHRVENVYGDKEEILEAVGHGNNSSSSTIGGAAGASSGTSSIVSLDIEKEKETDKTQ